MADQHKSGHAHHHILPTKVAVGIGTTLLFLTFVTVWIAGVDLGKLNFVVAFAVATFKATLVALFFMNLFYDRKENGMIFATSFLFLAIFIVLTSMDLFFRGPNVYVPKGALAAAPTASKLKDPWISTPELVAKGREQYQMLCATCHGAEGKGDGPAGSALNPHPRNFTAVEGWKNGRKITQIFDTITKGLGNMPTFSSESSDNRWALAHFVQSLGPKAEGIDNSDLAKIGIDPNKQGAEPEEKKEIPIDLAIERMAVPEK